MKRETSLYLDLVRFSAAIVVFITHVEVHANPKFSPFWREHLQYCSQTAIAVFFVLSGYVIAHVLATRERTPTEYAASRFARLYSVALPALILTAICNYFIQLKIPDIYARAGGGIHLATRYLGTGLFMSHLWLWPDLAPPNAGPFWTLSFEVSYYIGIAALVFFSGHTRILILLLLCAIAGPTVLLVAPTWILGFWAYHASKRFQFGRTTAVAMWMLSAVLLALCPLIEMKIHIPMPLLTLPGHDIGGLLAFFAAAGCFAISLHAFNIIADHARPFLNPVAVSIRWLGSITFALYLFHYPLLSFFATYRIPQYPFLGMVGGTLMIVATIGHLCEKSKGAYRRLFLSAFRRYAAQF